jgi:hypothetical protein
MRGQSLAEYALIASLIVIIATLCALWIGNDVARVLSSLGSQL